MRENVVIGTKNIITTSGVKQGGSSNIKLFTTYIYQVDPTIDAVNALSLDDLLQSMYILLIMDDTIIMATPREKM